MGSNVVPLDEEKRKKIDWSKNKGLIPAIVQDHQTLHVLMLGYMNDEALQKTQESQKVCFWSRSKKRLWTKGETTGHFLLAQEILIDCDYDTLLILAKPLGPTCHLGLFTCFGEFRNKEHLLFLKELEKTILERREKGTQKSYTASLFREGIEQCAKKVGEEAVEVVIAALKEGEKRLLEESADLIFHLMVLLCFKGLSLEDVVEQSLMARRKS